MLNKLQTKVERNKILFDEVTKHSRTNADTIQRTGIDKTINLKIISAKKRKIKGDILI